MEATQSYPNLLSEKQAAKRLGIARITLLRAREAGRIKFFRIGTRVLYCAEHLTDFLNACERSTLKPGCLQGSLCQGSRASFGCQILRTVARQLIRSLH